MVLFAASWVQYNYVAQEVELSVKLGGRADLALLVEV
jgi:hypothetical protein